MSWGETKTTWDRITDVKNIFNDFKNNYFTDTFYRTTTRLKRTPTTTSILDIGESNAVECFTKSATYQDNIYMQSCVIGQVHTGVTNLEGARDWGLKNTARYKIKNSYLTGLVFFISNSSTPIKQTYKEWYNTHNQKYMYQLSQYNLLGTTMLYNPTSVPTTWTSVNVGTYTNSGSTDIRYQDNKSWYIHACPATWGNLQSYYSNASYEQKIACGWLAELTQHNYSEEVETIKRLAGSYRSFWNGSRSFPSYADPEYIYPRIDRIQTLSFYEYGVGSTIVFNDNRYLVNWDSMNFIEKW